MSGVPEDCGSAAENQALGTGAAPLVSCAYEAGNVYGRSETDHETPGQSVAIEMAVPMGVGVDTQEQLEHTTIGSVNERPGQSVNEIEQTMIGSVNANTKLPTPVLILGVMLPAATSPTETKRPRFFFSFQTSTSTAGVLPALALSMLDHRLANPPGPLRFTQKVVRIAVFYGMIGVMLAAGYGMLGLVSFAHSAWIALVDVVFQLLFSGGNG